MGEAVLDLSSTIRLRVDRKRPVAKWGVGCGGVVWEGISETVSTLTGGSPVLNMSSDLSHLSSHGGSDSGLGCSQYSPLKLRKVLMSCSSKHIIWECRFG